MEVFLWSLLWYFLPMGLYMYIMRLDIQKGRPWTAGAKSWTRKELILWSIAAVIPALNIFIVLAVGIKVWDESDTRNKIRAWLNTEI